MRSPQVNMDTENVQSRITGAEKTQENMFKVITCDKE